MSTPLLRFNGAVERDPAVDAWLDASLANCTPSRVRGSP